MTNQLYYGDNLDVLRRKIASESVDLCYIDPPFNSKRNYFQIYNNQGSEDRAQAQAFVDTWNWGEEAVEGLDYILNIERLHGGVAGSVKWTVQTVELIRGLEKVLGRGSLLAYLVHMTLRIVEIHRVLKPTGSFYLHCDPTASHYLKLVLDAVFCGQGGDYRNEIVWQRSTGKALMSRKLPFNHDTILCYGKGADSTWNNDTIFVAYDESNLPGKTSVKYSHRDEDGRLYRLDNLINPNPNRPNLTYEFLGVHRVWRWTKDRMQQAYADGLVIQTKPGTVPQLKRYLGSVDKLACPQAD